MIKSGHIFSFCEPWDKKIRERAQTFFGDDWMNTCTYERQRNAIVSQDGKNKIEVVEKTSGVQELVVSHLTEFGTEGFFVNDPAGSEPPKTTYNANGIITWAAYYNKGKRHNPQGGEKPASTLYRDGLVREERHYLHGIAVNSPDGRPHHLVWNEDGLLVAAQVIQSDGGNHWLSGEDAERFIAASKTCAIERLCGKNEGIITLSAGSKTTGVGGLVVN